MPPADVTRDDLALGDLPTSAEIVFLSLNRYERKKNIDLVVAAFGCVTEPWKPLLYRALLLENLERSLGAKCHLAIAGGYDSRVTENVQHYSELKGLAKHLALFETRGRPDRVTFFRSPSDGEKRALLDRCTCVVYTPRGEHFGIVPVEAMAAGRPVIAVNDGGPKESIVPDVTGFLCDGSPQSFAFAMEKVVLNADWLVKKFGDAGISRANTVFSKAAFGRKLDSICARLVSEGL